MGRAYSKRIKDQMRKEEYERLKFQTQITKDYLLTHSKIARRSKVYPLTEKIATGTPEELSKILNDDSEVVVDPNNYPEGLVLPWVMNWSFFDVDFSP